MRAGPGPVEEAAGSPSGVCPHLGLVAGGEGGPPDGRQGGWRRGAFLAGVCVYGGMYVFEDQDLACVYHSTHWRAY